MAVSDIVIRGAREHNLQDVSLTLPRNRLICFTGVSGSGKSSLAFDTLYAEGQRRYVESLSSFARQFLGQMPKPDVDSIEGLSPAISISQKTAGQSPRSTVGTITEIYDYLRVLYARVGVGHCPQCGRPITAQTRQQILDRIGQLPAGTRFLVLAPMIRGQKGEYRDLFEDLLKQGFVRARVDGAVVRLTENLRLDRQMRHNIEVVIDRLVAGPSSKARLAEAVELALRLGEGNLIIAPEPETAEAEVGKRKSEVGVPNSELDGDLPSPQPSPKGRGDREPSPQPSPKGRGGKKKSPRGPAPTDIQLSAHYACTHCQLSFEPPSPQMFSFNSPQGMCPDCSGLGEIYTFDPDKLIPDPSRSFQQGCVEMVGQWRDMGRWRRHIYRGVAETLERKHGLPPGTVLETAWEEVDPKIREKLLWGTGDEHVTFTWRSGPSGYKWGGKYEGIIPRLLSLYRSTKSRIQRRGLEKHMRVIGCTRCGGQRLNAQARAVTLTTRSPQFAEGGGWWVTGGGWRESRDDNDGVRGCRGEGVKDEHVVPTGLPYAGHAAVLGACPPSPDHPVTPSPRHPLIPSPATRTLPEVCALAVSAAEEFFRDLELDATGQQIAAEALKEIRGRLQFLKNVGLDYLTLDRTAPTLSGGEMQRIRLAGQIGCGLVGVLYILDEPSVGLHPRDNDRLLETLAQLRDQGNTVVVVEHDEDTMRAADCIVDFGPGPGVRGGKVVATGPVAQIIAEKESITGQYLSGQRRIEIPKTRKPPNGRKLVVHGATHNNLKRIDVEIPLGLFVCVTGVSGSGKSSLVDDILVEALRRDLNGGIGNPGAHEKIEGLEHLDRMISIDQSPIGRTPRSNPSTYIKVFDDIRNLYAQLPESKARGYQPGRFSFNVAGGRCEACEGNGSNRLEMDFLADIWVTCPVCEGHRFSRETLQVRYKGKSIAQVLEMDVQEALAHFENIPSIRHKLQTLHDVGMDYVKLGQPSPTLSGGEAQRIKLARELVKKSTGKTLYLLDEPTTGLHFADIELLLKVLHDFVDAGNTVLVVEHNLEVIKTADWLIDLGPEGGEAGGWIVAAGTPEDLAKAESGKRKAERGSHTGEVLQHVLNGESGKRKAESGTPDTKPLSAFRDQPAVGARLSAFPSGGTKSARRAELAECIKVRGARQHNLKGIDVDVARGQMTVCCGPSGSGKSSLAMDTIYAEGQRRYVESLSAYARQFIAQMQKPKFDHIEGLSPAIAIEQKHSGQTPRSTVGTVTEIYDYLRILMARLGQARCPDCNIPVGTQSADEIIAKIMACPEGTRLFLMAPLEIQVGERYETLWDEMRAAGYARIRVDRQTYPIDSPPAIDRRRKHAVEVVIDRVTVRGYARSRVAGSVENALALGRGVLHLARPQDDLPEPQWPVDVHSQHYVCGRCGRSFEPLSPHNFSFNSSLGWCPACEGLGVQTGANPAALLRDPKRTLAEGAVALWPESDSRIFSMMLSAWAQATGVPTDVPFEQLGSRHRRLVMHGTADQWFDVHLPLPLGEGRIARPVFRFQYKGLYPALEEASRVSPGFRGKLEHLIDEVECTVCSGSRLRDDAAAVQLTMSKTGTATIDELCRRPLGRLLEDFRAWKPSDTQRKIAGEVVREITNRLQFLVDVGLDYLTLARPAPTLSGGETQRIRLAAQVGSGLCGVLYVLDEPTIGMHPRDNRRLLEALRKLRDLGNTLLLVEHDREVIANADQLLDFGPAAGRNGGEIVARGTPQQVAKANGSVTGPYLAGSKAIPVPTSRRMKSIAAGERAGVKGTSPARRKKKTSGGRPHPNPLPKGEGTIVPPGGGWLEIVGARHNNLKNIDVRIPLGTLTVVTGVSGSGKSSLVEDILYNALARKLHRAKVFPGTHDDIRGLELVNKVIRVDQQPLGQTPTSNPATFTGVFDLVRSLYAQLPDAKLRGYSPRRFSFNVPGGRCEKCEGNGQRKIEMHFLPDVWVECDACRGRRYEPQTLEVKFHGQSIADVLDMSCGQALQLFENVPPIRRILQTLCDVGLDYLTLGQPAPTLSGGEAQRVKLAAELSRPDTGQTLYLLDEPTTGLHFDDLAKLLDVLNRLVDLGNTVVVIEHNLDVVKTADWVIDLGPEAGNEGGFVVVAGTPEDVAAFAKAESGREGAREETAFRFPLSAFRSHTGEVLAPVLAAGPLVQRKPHDFATESANRRGDLDIHEVGREAKMPWETDGRRWHSRDRVGRNGSPCRWDGRILAEVIDRIQESGLFSDTDWGNRSVVEIRSAKKSDGWFFHAITGEEWLLKMKFRTARNTFRPDDLIAKLDLKPLNEMHDLPLYGTEPRVKCRNLRGPWQEIEVRVHNYQEIDRPEFWGFVDRVVAGFRSFTDRVRKKPEDLMPWKALGRAWHFLRKGFLKGGPPRWEPAVLERLCSLLESAAPGLRFGWQNKVVVPVHLSGGKKAWACLLTKKPDAVYLYLFGPHGRFALGQITGLGLEPSLEADRPGVDRVLIKFRSMEDLGRGDLPGFLKKHLASLGEN